MDSQTLVPPGTPSEAETAPRRPFTAPSVEEIGQLRDLTLQVS
jgi:hypothetical protein